MTDYIYRSATELAALIREGQATSTDVVREHLERIKEHNDKFNALISVFEDEALATAAECDRETAEGRSRGPLHGVPVTIKEQFWIKGKSSTTNFKMLADFVAPEDAVIVDRIRKSGAVILGQTNVPRGLLDYQVHGDIYPTGKNPFNTEHTPGGSTGGGAAALAAGFTTLELGADLGGSVRVPASFCGLYGLKPTEKTVPLHGNVPLPKHASTFIVHMVQAGPLARNLDDLEVLWRTIVGPHESDRNIPDINWRPAAKNALSEYKIAWTDGWPDYQSSGPVSDAIGSIAAKLKENGCDIEKRIPDETLHRDSLENWVGTFPYVVAQGLPWYVRALFKQQLNSSLLKGVRSELPEIARAMSRGFKLHANHYGEMMLGRSMIVERWERFFGEYDFLICPLAFGPAFKRCKTGSKLSYDGREMIYADYVFPYAAPFNMSGNPSVAVPLGLSPEGLPIGAQIVGKYWSEPELINFAKKVAALTDGFVRPEGF